MGILKHPSKLYCKRTSQLEKFKKIINLPLFLWVDLQVFWGHTKFHSISATTPLKKPPKYKRLNFIRPWSKNKSHPRAIVSNKWANKTIILLRVNETISGDTSLNLKKKKLITYYYRKTIFNFNLDVEKKIWKV